MYQDTETPSSGVALQAVHSNIVAGNDINLSYQATYQNVTVNNPELSVLTRLKTALNPVTSASYDSYEAKYRCECFPNTRVQVLDDIEAWINDASQAPIFILDGVAGLGKSTVAQTIAVRAAALGLLGASFFFSRDEDLRKVAGHFFPTIAYQLSCYDGQFAIRISHSLDQSPDAPAKRLHLQLPLLLREPLEVLLSQRSKPTLLVVDALDECEEGNAEELLLLLGQHVPRMKGLKILITTRPEWHLRNILDQDRNHEKFRLHEIEDSIVHSDIRLYLQSQLSAEEIRKVSRDRQSSWQPSIKDIEMLCRVCGTLFIIAATMTKFILDRKRLNPQRQLARLLDGVSTSGFADSKCTDVLDKTYLQIILAAQPDPDGDNEDWFRDLNKVLGGLIALSNLLPCNALASLLDMSANDVEATLSHLHSLVAPAGSGKNMTFRVHHKSFPDFITDRERIRRVLSNCQLKTHLDAILWINMDYQHRQLAKACLRIMNCNLNWNMANISSDDWYKDKDDIPHVVPQLISRDLAYAAMHWAWHLQSAHGLDEDHELQNGLDTWTSRHILAWTEVMVILDQVGAIYDALFNAIDSVKNSTDKGWEKQAIVQELLSDAQRFVQRGGEVIKLSPLHIYWSCLPFIPMKTLLYQAYGTTPMFKIRLGNSNQWSPTLELLPGHRGSVFSVAFASDGLRLASGSADSTIRLWDAKSGAHIFTFTGHSGSVHAVTFSSDGSRLASGSEDNTIRVWDPKTTAHLLTLNGHSETVYSVAFSGDDSRIASGSRDNTVRLWDTTTGTHILTLNGHSDGVRTIAFSSDSFRLASGSWDSTIRLWDAKTGVQISVLTNRHSDHINSVAFSNDASRLASGFNDGTIYLWDATTGTHISVLTGHTKSVRSVAFSIDGSQLASGSFDRTIRIWDTKSGDNISTLFSGHYINAVSFSGDGSRLAFGSMDYTVQFWDAITTGGHITSSNTTGDVYWVNSVSFSNDGSQLAAASSDGGVGLWDTKMGVSLNTLRPTGPDIGLIVSICSVAFSRDGSWVASGSKVGPVRLWDTKTGEQIHRLTGHSDLVYSIAFSSDGSRLASASKDDTIRLWDPRIGRCIATLTDHLDSVHLVAFSRDGSLLVSGSVDGTIRSWSAKTGAHISTLVTSPPWTRLFAQVASESWESAVQLCNAKRREELLTLLPPWNHLTIVDGILLRNDSQLATDVFAPRSRLIRARDGNSVHVLLAVVRESPHIYGLMMANLVLEGDGNLNWEVVLMFWFPPDTDAHRLAVSSSSSQVGVGCKSGKVVLLEFLSDFPIPR